MIMMIRLRHPAVGLSTVTTQHRFSASVRNGNSANKPKKAKHHPEPGIRKTPTQQMYWDALCSNSRLTIASGVAGTGKTYFACRYALEAMLAETYNKIVFTRPIVTVENEDIGFLPGGKNEKLLPYTQPLFDICEENGLGKKVVEQMIKNNKIELVPLGFMRGRTFRHALIIGDEMQNASPHQILTMLSRIGIGSKVVLTGDSSQCDLGITGVDGLSDLSDKIKKCDMCGDIDLIEFGQSDVKRDDFVKKVLELYSEKEIDEAKEFYEVIDIEEEC